MTKMIAISDWLNIQSNLNPDLLQFKAKLSSISGGCGGCCFRYQNSSTCKAACAATVRASMPDCDDRDSETGRTFIYTLAQQDPRQLNIE